MRRQVLAASMRLSVIMYLYMIIYYLWTKHNISSKKYSTFKTNKTRQLNKISRNRFQDFSIFWQVLLCNIFMNNKLLICILLSLVILISAFTLVRLILIPGENIDPPFRLRYIYFLGLHFMFFVSFLISIKLSRIHQYFTLGFINCLVVVITISICEKVVEPLQTNAHYLYHASDALSERIQMTYIFLYYIVYAYSMIGGIICVIFLTATQILIRYEEYKFNEHIDQCLENLNQMQNLGDIQCAICLEQAKQNMKYVKVRVCRHLFHRMCLIEWLSHNQTCPLCRKNIFRLQVQNQQGSEDHQRSQNESNEQQNQEEIQNSNRQQQSQISHQQSIRQKQEVSERQPNNQVSESSQKSRQSSRRQSVSRHSERTYIIQQESS